MSTKPSTFHLAETGQQLLADADVITIPTTQATWAAITRRYG